MTKLKILILSTSLGLGGADRQIILLTRILINRGYKVKIVSLTPLGSMGVEAQVEGILVQSLNMTRGVPDPRAILTLINIFRQYRPAILVNFMSHAILLGRLSGYLARVPVIISSIRNEKFGNNFLYYSMKLTSWMDDLYTTNSGVVAHKLIETNFTHTNHIYTTPNCVDLDCYNFSASNVRNLNLSALRDSLGVPPDSFLWLAIGRLIPQKDFPTLLKAVQVLSDDKAHLRIAGIGPLREDLTRLITDLGIADRVAFLGPRLDVPDLLTIADGFVLSSAWEGLPNVVMEALASKTPIVATRVGGVVELVQDQQTGFLVAPRNYQELAEAMQKLMHITHDQRQLMGILGRQHIERYFSSDSVADVWENLFQGLLTQKKLSNFSKLSS